ncbi:hypothetical protein ElyMa_006207600 [Elysia marginata]|uniref:Uncharacterized protein n=1 Tax=Elysia marginata TaxID=1093978 RepID=A0AAV4H7J8_9GAST|nr:hypothetical protein ElyMa_006207600 [Elysia marginata]
MASIDELTLYEQYLALADKLRIADEDKSKWVCDKVATAVEARNRERELEDRIEKERKEHEIRVLTLKETANHSDNASGGGAATEKPSKKPRFPMFNSLVQDIDVYLENFSRHATAAKWPVNEWPSLLFNLLQGSRSLAVIIERR